MTTVPVGDFLFPPSVAEPSTSREREAVRVFRWLLAIYTAIVLTKIHELVPLTSRLQPVKFLGALLLLNALIVLRSRAIAAVLRTPSAACTGVIFVLALLSIAGAVWPGHSVEFMLSEFWKTLAFFVIAATAWCDRATLRHSIKTLVLCQSIVAITLLAGVAQENVGRAYVGQTLDPNESGLQLLVVLPFALYLASERRWWKFVGIAGMLLMIAGIVKTGSRAGFLGLIVLACWLLIQVRPHRRRITAMIAVAGGAAVVALTAGPATRERFSTILHPTEDYNYTYREGRVSVWKRGLRYMADRPLLGVGVYDFPVAEGVLSGKTNEGYGIKYSAAHNIFVQVGAELGVLGLLAFLRMLWAAGVSCRRARQLARRLWARGDPLAKGEAKLAEAVLGALVALLVGGFFLSVAYSPVTFFVVAMCIAVRLGSPLRPVPAGPDLS